MRAQGVATLRVTKVRNESFENDYGQFEMHPSFDVVVNYNRTISLTVPGVTSATGTIFTVDRGA
jgi:hypothetical protein